jgi:hypothetical protein
VGKETALSSDRSDSTTKKLLHPLPLTAEEDIEAISLLALCELHRTINFSLFIVYAIPAASVKMKKTPLREFALHILLDEAEPLCYTLKRKKAAMKLAQ